MHYTLLHNDVPYAVALNHRVINKKRFIKQTLKPRIETSKPMNLPICNLQI